jgi:hypothetical protein
MPGSGSSADLLVCHYGSAMLTQQPLPMFVKQMINVIGVSEWCFDVGSADRAEGRRHETSEGLGGEQLRWSARLLQRLKLGEQEQATATFVGDVGGFDKPAAIHASQGLA